MTVARRQFASLITVAIVTMFFSSSVAGTAQTAMTGEVVETFCWAKLRVGGVSHASCGIECAKRGIPIALVDDQSGKAFVLLPGRDKRSIPSDLVAAMGRRVTVRGEKVSRGGSNFLTVQSWSPAK